eukprot:TRINITY_DN10075_c0_g1_i18.p1 TRINITY_DN10075_c0_g1~~TRINITY_DN10075_c0_g1_i18.p1  ORF type:complete len:294 (+),score=61.82 TRINITY_DN10075_c0_g1_i18:101-982(+)
MSHRRSPLTSRSPFAFGLQFPARNASNPKSKAAFSQVHCSPPLLIDSCQLIAKSRDEILGLALHSRKKCLDRNKAGIPSNKTRNHSLRQKPPNAYQLYRLKTEPKQLFQLENTSNEYSSGSHYVKDGKEQSERLTAMDISEGVVYGCGGIGFNYSKKSIINSPANEERKEFANYSQLENVSCKIRHSTRQRESLETIKSLETAREDSSEVEESSAQVVYTQPVEEIWPRTNLLPGNSRARTRTKPDAVARSAKGRRLVMEVVEETREISKPYVGLKIRTKREKERVGKRQLLS